MVMQPLSPKKGWQIMFDGTMTPARLVVMVAVGALMWLGLVALGMWIIR